MDETIDGDDDSDMGVFGNAAALSGLLKSSSVDLDDTETVPEEADKRHESDAVALDSVPIETKRNVFEPATAAATTSETKSEVKPHARTWALCDMAFVAEEYKEFAPFAIRPGFANPEAFLNSCNQAIDQIKCQKLVGICHVHDIKKKSTESRADSKRRTVRSRSPSDDDDDDDDQSDRSDGSKSSDNETGKRTRRPPQTPSSLRKTKTNRKELSQDDRDKRAFVNKFCREVEQVDLDQSLSNNFNAIGLSNFIRSKDPETQQNIRTVLMNMMDILGEG